MSVRVWVCSHYICLHKEPVTTKSEIIATSTPSSETTSTNAATITYFTVSSTPSIETTIPENKTTSTGNTTAQSVYERLSNIRHFTYMICRW